MLSVSVPTTFTRRTLISSGVRLWSCSPRSRHTSSSYVSVSRKARRQPELIACCQQVLALCVNMGASVVSVFGPLILQGLAGFDGYTTTLLNLPFGALQVVLIYLASWCATRFKYKAPVFMVFMLPVIVGCVLMYTLPRTPANKGPLLLGYYCLAFVFSANPLIVAWQSANV